MKFATCTLAGFALALLTSGVARTQPSDDDRQPETTRQAQAVSRDVFEKLERSQELVRDEDYDAALEVLSALLAEDDLTDYERSNALRYKGYAHYSAGQTEAAIRAFADVLDVPGLEAQVRAATLYTLAQLATASERFEDALRYLDAWFGLAAEPEPAAYILRAQILYSLERYEEMITPIRNALATRDRRPLR